VVVCHRHGEINNGKNEEYESLYQRHQQSEDLYRNREDEGYESKEYAKHGVVGEHVAHQSNRQGYQSGEVTDGLNDHHQQHQGEGSWMMDGADKVLEVGNTLCAHAKVMSRDEYNQTHGGRRVQVVCWGTEARNAAHDIADADKQGQGGQYREGSLYPPIFHHLRGQVVDCLKDHFDDRGYTESWGGPDGLFRVSEATACDGTQNQGQQSCEERRGDMHHPLDLFTHDQALSQSFFCVGHGGMGNHFGKVVPGIAIAAGFGLWHNPNDQDHEP